MRRPIVFPLSSLFAVLFVFNCIGSRAAQAAHAVDSDRPALTTNRVVKIRIQFTPPPESPDSLSYGYCSGTLLTESHVLTADHCFRGGTVIGISVATANEVKLTGDVASLSEYSATADISTYRILNSVAGTQLIFTPGDLAVFQLSSPIPLADIPPIHLAFTDAAVGAQINAGHCKIYGYGSDHPELDQIDASGLRMDNRKLRVRPFVPSTARLQKSRITVSGEVLAVTPAILEDGDSGGPLLCTDDSGATTLIAVNRSEASIMARTAQGSTQGFTQFDLDLFELFAPDLNWLHSQLSPSLLRN